MMGLFINNDKHPDVYKNDGQINEPNQRSFRQDHQSEMLEQQQKTNEALQQSFDELKKLYEKQATKQAKQWKNFGNRLYELKRGNLQHEKTEYHVLERLKNLDEKSTNLQKILENEQVVNQDFMNNIQNLSQSNQEVVDRLDTATLANQQLELKVNEQLDLQKQIAQQILNQDDTQQEVLKRLDNQDALMEKVLRQIDYFRSVLFERTNFLAEKIENGYNLTSSYFTKLVTGSDKPLTQFLLKQKENQKNKE